MMLAKWFHSFVEGHRASFPDRSVGKESGSIPGPGRSPGEGIGYTLQYSWASLMAQLVKNPPAVQETLVWFLGQEDSRRRDRLPPPVFLGFPYGSAGKESAHNAGELGFIPELGRSPGEGEGSPLQYLGLENSMDCIVHEVAKSRTRLSSIHFHWTTLVLLLLKNVFNGLNWIHSA